MNHSIFRVIVSAFSSLILLFMSGCSDPMASPSQAISQPATPNSSQNSDSIFLPLVVRGTPQPGLILSGYVRQQDGAPLAGVKILRGFASYQPELVATTDINGFYESPYAFIPGDEMVTVIPELAGYSFDPAQEYWRHYYGFEDKKLDFSAIPIP
jgi:hypothetical protein